MESNTEMEKIVSALQYTIGQRERMKALMAAVGKILSEKTAIDIAKAIEWLPNASSERFQDVFAFLQCGAKRGGFFVEFGACDGIIASNTLLLEQHFEWDGILAEPDPIWHDSLVKNRTARIDQRCVSAYTGGHLEFNQSKTPGVSSVHKDHDYLGEIEKTITVPTVSLLDLLKDHDAPSYIEFLSIDTEGHELEALRTFDFNRYKFGFICVEQHNQTKIDNNVSRILDGAGYEILYPRSPDLSQPPHMQVTGDDLFYVPKKS